MRTCFRAFSLLGLACLFPAVAYAAEKGWPSEWDSTLPARVALVGRGPAGADSAAGHFEIVLRDHYGDPCPYMTVILDFSTARDFRIAADQLDPRLRTVCAHQTVHTVCDGAGVARFTIVGGGRQPLPPVAADDRVSISVEGVPFSTVPCVAYDLDGVNGLTLTDVSLWGADFFSPLYPARADINGDGDVTLLDLSVWALAYFSGGSAQSAPAYCP